MSDRVDCRCLYALRGSPCQRLLTQLAGAGVVGVMIVAWVTDLRSGFFTFRPGEAWEYVMVLTVLGVVVAGLGAGAWSLDHAVGIFENPSVGALAIALVVSGRRAARRLLAATAPGTFPGLKRNLAKSRTAVAVASAGAPPAGV
ncbi:MAG: hypothetical protein AB1679_36390 [Actinomycetota bacterium]